MLVAVVTETATRCVKVSNNGGFNKYQLPQMDPCDALPHALVGA